MYLSQFLLWKHHLDGARPFQLPVFVFCCCLAGISTGDLTIHDGVNLTIPSFTYVHGNASFRVSGRLLFVQGHDLANVKDEISGRILLVDHSVNSDIASWAAKCHAKGCVGVVMFNLPDLWDFVAWRYLTYSTIPCVVLAQAAPITDPWSVNGNLATIDSDAGPSPTELWIGNSATITWFAFQLFLNAFILLYSLYKLGTFAVDLHGRVRMIPIRPLLVFLFQIASSTIRGLWFLNAVFFQFYGLSPAFYRFTLSGHLPFSLATLLLVAISMRAQVQSAKPESSRWRLISNVAIVFCLATLLLDEILTILSAAFHVELEADNTTFTNITYLVLNVPVAALEIFYAVKLSRILNSTSGSGSRSERFQTRRFTNGVICSATIGISILTIYTIYWSLLDVVGSHQIIMLTVIMLFEAVQGIMNVCAFVQRNSLLRAFAMDASRRLSLTLRNSSRRMMASRRLSKALAAASTKNVIIPPENQNTPQQAMSTDT